MIYTTVPVIAAYLLGAMPTAYIFARVLKGIDIREHGSGNVGATNVVRTVGKVPGIIVLVIDFLKGIAAVTLIPLLMKTFFPELDVNYGDLCIFLGAAVISGHIWTVFLAFKGGKGVATTAGVIVGLYPWIFLGCLLIWVAVFAVWKYVSVASITAAVALPIISVIAGKDLKVVLFTSLLCIFGIYKHRANIKRLIQGKETRIVKVKNH
ncbi:MAG: glycerol-3-phosphate 1-O-acyltransferase PlsY [Candidatus Omnitrophota bacterium]|nr:glycerol-3-phosphate 1-O-acyltransferase PlsY [Candidatus Omnitrophota bacterium]